MLGVLIVDDEKLACADILYKVSRSGLCFKWVMEASSAEDAFEKIKEYKPDILLTDIMMGEMSGIELIKKAIQYVPDIATVLISGHSDFQYAKEAIALGVVEYLLKPVRQDEVNAVLTKVMHMGMQRRNFLLDTSGCIKEKEYGLNEREREHLAAFIYGIRKELDFTAGGVFPRNARYYQIGIIRTPVRLRSDKLRIAMQEAIQDITGPWSVIFCESNQGQQFFVIAASNEMNPKRAGEALLKRFREISIKIRNKLEIGLIIGLSDVSELIRGILIEQARQALDLRFSMDEKTDSRIYCWKEWERSVSADLPENELKLYRRFLAAGELKEALEVVRRIFSTDDQGMVMHIRILYIELICILARTSLKKAGGSIVSMLGSECLSGRIIDEFDSREELIESLCRRITAVRGQWMSGATDSRSVLCIVKDYIEDNYTCSELSTNYLANKFCISLGYLSTSFNKEFGLPVTKYIINLRIDYAKKLLRETRSCIGVISENCGFNNASYFMRTFKKYIGCTPNEFRENDYSNKNDTKIVV